MGGLTGVADPIGGSTAVRGAVLSPARVVAALRDTRQEAATTRQSLILMANTAGTALLGVVYWGIAARGLPIAVVGAGTALIAAISTISNLSQLNLYSSMGVLLPRAGAGALRLLIRIYQVTAAVTVVAAVGMVLLVPSITDRLELHVPGGDLWVLLAAAAWTIFALQDGALIAVRSARLVLVSNFGYGIVKIAVLAACIHLLPQAAISLSWYGPLVVIVVIVNWRLYLRLRRGSADQPASDARSVTPLMTGAISRFVAVDYVGFLLIQVATTALPVFVTSIVGPAAAAVFATCWMVSGAVDLLATNVALSMSVSIAHRPGTVARVLRTMFPRLVVGMIVTTAVGIVAAPWILGAFGAEYAQQGTTILRILLVSCIFRAVVTMCTAVSRSLMRPGLAVVMQAIVAVTVLGVGLPAMALGGLAALAWAWLGAQVVAAVASTVLMLKNLQPVGVR